MAPTVSIRRSLLTNLILIVVLLGLGIIAMMALSTRQAVQELSGSLIRQASRRTEAKLQGFFRPVNRQVEAVRMWGETGLLDLTTPDELRQLLTPLMREFPWSSATFIANEEGREFLLRHHGGNWSSRQIWRDEWQDRAQMHHWTSEAPELVESEIEVDYDPRTRPWYLGAVELLEEEDHQGQQAPVFWTEPYRFFTTGQPGFTAATAYRDQQGVISVVGIDIALMEISRFTSEIHLLEDSTVFVVTEDGRMVGVPRPPREVLPQDEMENLLLKRPEELGTTAAQDATDKLIESPSTWDQPVRIVSDGEAWWGQISPFALSPDHKLLIGVAVGEKAILGQIRQQRLWVAGITLAVLALAIWRAANMARGYSRPVEQLVEESERISTGDLEPGKPIRSRISEVQQLAEAHDQMRGGLKTLLKLERDLQVARQIQESTLPRVLPELPGIELSTWNQPADETGGDSYDVMGLQRAAEGPGLALTEAAADRAVLMLADATGHGIGPALSVTQLRAMLRMAVRLNADLTDLVTHLNQQLHSDLPSGRFITAWFGMIDTATYSLATFSAGQAPLLHYRAAADEFEVLGSDAIPLGMFPAIKVTPPDPIQLQPGDLYIILSDGFFEAKDPEGEEQGTDKICEAIRQSCQESAETIQQQLRLATDKFTQGAPPDDDRTIIIIKRT